VFFWFVGTAVLGVWSVFRDPRFDYRLLIVGVLAPDVIDGIWGGARAFHSVVTIVGVLVLVMLVTAGRRPIRRRLLAIPIGSFVHLIVDFFLVAAIVGSYYPDFGFDYLWRHGM